MVYFRRLPFRRALRLVTRVAALLDVDEELPCFFGEIFFSAIPLTPLRVPAQPIAPESPPEEAAGLCRGSQGSP